MPSRGARGRRRAGDQGRGFAVVADEVRKLAEESQGASRSIARLVAEIQADTQSAVDVVDESARRTEDGAAAVGARVGDVAAVAEASSAAAEQVSASTQQTSASAEEIAASAADLASTAEELEQLVARFRVATAG